MMYSRVALAAVLLTASVAGAQERQVVAVPGPQHDKMVVEAQAQLAPARVPLESKIVRDAPYSAEVVTEHIQQLADGNRIARRNTRRVYRDSEGRTRREEISRSGEVVQISITDPIAGKSISLYPQTRTAWITPSNVAHALVATMRSDADAAEVDRRRKIEEELAKAHAEGVVRHAEVVPPAPPPPPPPPPPPAPPEGYLKTEKLPAKNIEGVMCEGTRTTRTLKPGMIGNEQPIVSVTEEWRSPELQVLVMTRTSDPRTGDDTYQLQNIVRAEQNRSLFEVPSDYSVRETGIRRLPQQK